jgi:hypothetical protein
VISRKNLGTGEQQQSNVLLLLPFWALFRRPSEPRIELIVLTSWHTDFGPWKSSCPFLSPIVSYAMDVPDFNVDGLKFLEYIGLGMWFKQ